MRFKPQIRLFLPFQPFRAITTHQISSDASEAQIFAFYDGDFYNQQQP